MEESNPELESFRQDWKAEVAARATRIDQHIPWKTSALQSSVRAARRPPVQIERRLSKGNKTDVEEDAEGSSIGRSEHANILPQPSNDIQGFGGTFGSREPESALEHYEKAVEREDQGNLGDSLSLYRKAFRMDHRVDIAYKNKHHPATIKNSNLSIQETVDASTRPRTTADSTTAPSTQPQHQPPKSYNDLVCSFANLAIAPTTPEIEGMPAPTCPIASLPDELIMNILTHLAIMDVAAYARSAQICKKLAYLVATEEQPWKRVCLGSECGFGAMFYEWQTEIEGGPLEGPPTDIGSDSETLGDISLENVALPNDPSITKSLLGSVYGSSWRRMFRQRPRIRFNGCYISTVNYMRPGQASTNQLTWNSPVHIVTYYRYLRFFRDGTALSLCTTSEPIEVIPFFTKSFTKDKLKIKIDPNLPQLPTSVMNSCHRGRWRLSTLADHSADTELKDAESEVYVETEGVGTKYIYRMELSLRSVGKGARNNKLAWKSYWHYNKLTDDWGEFGLRNDKAFFWSRVKSWGMGE